jgi:hypothetical protein
VQSSFHLFLGQSKHTWESHLGEDVVDREIYNYLFAGMQFSNLGEMILGTKLQKIKQKINLFWGKL